MRAYHNYSVLRFNGCRRFVLSYKNLPFTTIWVEYANITTKSKEIGASPTACPDGSKCFTLPILSDPNTGTVVSDSWDIAQYLDETYPEKPIFPNGSKGLIKAFEPRMAALLGASVKFILLRTRSALNDCSLEYWSGKKEEDIGGKVDEWSPEGPTRDSHWAIIETSFLGSARTWYDQVEGKWLMGDTFSYADIILAARLFWFKRVLLDDEWKRVASIRDGNWGKFLADVERECNLVLHTD